MHPTISRSGLSAARLDARPRARPSGGRSGGVVGPRLALYLGLAVHAQRAHPVVTLPTRCVLADRRSGLAGRRGRARRLGRSFPADVVAARRRRGPPCRVTASRVVPFLATDGAVTTGTSRTGAHDPDWAPAPRRHRPRHGLTPPGDDALVRRPARRAAHRSGCRCRRPCRWSARRACRRPCSRPPLTGTPCQPSVDHLAAAWPRPADTGCHRRRATREPCSPSATPPGPACSKASILSATIANCHSAGRNPA